MGLSFIQPAFLLFLLLLVPLWGVAIAGHMIVRRSVRGRHVAAWRIWTSLLIRSVILSALVLALAGTQFVRAAPTMTTVFVLDSSDSIGPAMRARGKAYIADALRRMPEGDRASVVVFGNNAIVERPPSTDKSLVRLLQVPDGSATDIGRALQLGLATLPADTHRRIVLLSDGAETTSTALEVALQAQAARIPIETVSLIGPAPADDVTVEALEVPGTAREGQNVRLVAQVRSVDAGSARLRLLRDRQPVLDTTVELEAGVTRIPLSAVAPRGFHTWEVHVDAASDGVGANNVAFGFTDVVGPPVVLLIEGAPGRATNLATALRSAGLTVDVQLPAALPQSLVALDAFDAVVLVDVPYRSLPEAGARLLPTYVRELGHALMMVGGEDSYAAGGYLDTPVEAALPVTMRTRGAEVRPDVALVMVIDRSGSMSGEKLNLAKEGVAQAYAALEETDRVGLVMFDDSAQWVVDLQPKPSTDAFLQGISSVSEGGGTNLRPGLELAAGALEGTDAKIKHVVLLTDGQADQNYDDVVERLRANGITLSSVGVGDGYDPHLRDIAPRTGGRFYEALNFSDIPRLFFDETVRIARRGIVEETFTPRLADPLGPAVSVVNELREVPQLYGYNATTPRDTAQVALATPDGDPILAAWQYGLGRAAAWTPDMEGRWARDWVGWQGFGRFSNLLVDALVQPSIVEGYEASAMLAGSAVVVEVRADRSDGQTQGRPTGRLLGPDNTTVDVPLIEREPGLYRGSVPLPAAGVYRVQVTTNNADGDEQIVATTGAVVPASVEYLQREGNPGLLKALADATGGHIDFPSANAFVRPPAAARTVAPIIWPLLWSAVLLWPIDIAIRRLLLPAMHIPVALRQALRRTPTGQPTPSGAALRRAEALLRTRRPTTLDGGAAQTTQPTITARDGTSLDSAASVKQQPTSAETDGAAAPTRPSWRTTRRNVPERPAQRRR